MGKYRRYLDIKIIAISSILLFLVILQVSNVNATSTVTDRNAKVKLKIMESEPCISNY
ncbi:type-F conjugative transfer system TraW domain protein [Rickettsia hoogstraalii str. RCCE3]|nr:type-F conjugative transfer system TraW domain protein [Rickettsia hoogstraalii str. RCCE3]